MNPGRQQDRRTSGDRVARRKVVSIVGPGRSGSTILSAVLGEVPGVFGAGELRWLWSRDLPEQRICGCERTPATCPVWSRVVEETLAVPPSQQTGPQLAAVVRPIAAAQHAVCSPGNRRRLLSAPRTGRPMGPSFDLLRESTVAVLDALFRASGARTIVESSKRPQEAAVLAASRRYDHYVVHLVRDPRAVVHSWHRAKPLPTSAGGAVMPTRNLPKTLMRWLENCSGAEYLRSQVPSDHWLPVRYEDFADRPRATVQLILDMLGEHSQPPFLDDETVVLAPNHYLSGNPSRFRTGPVHIVPDDRWRSSLPRSQRRVVEAATLPFLLRYGYPLLGRGAASTADC